MILYSQHVEWLDVTSADWRKANEWMRKHADQSVSFTDCLSFVLMKREAISRVFGFGRHFVTAGFRLWPEQAV